MEQQIITIRKEMRKWGKPTTVVEGLDPKSVDLSTLATKLKASCACGGTAKNGQIILQGDHREKVKKILLDSGFSGSSIEVH